MQFRHCFEQGEVQFYSEEHHWVVETNNFVENIIKKAIYHLMSGIYFCHKGKFKHLEYFLNNVVFMFLPYF